MQELLEKHMRAWGLHAVAVAVFIIISCGGDRASTSSTGAAAPLVAVSILPQKEFVERIAGDRFEVIVLIPPGATPATYEPAPSDMAAMSEAVVWFTIGVPFETAWIPRFLAVNADLDTVNTAAGINRLPIVRHSRQQEHGSDGHTGHDSTDDSLDPHIWLSPELVRTQAATITGTLSELDPENADIYAGNLSVFEEDIDSIQISLHAMLDPLEGSSFIVFHPSWGYFADEFGLLQVAIEEAGNQPSPDQLARLVSLAEERSIRVIFISPQFSASSAGVLAAEIDGGTLQIDPLGSDWEDCLLTAARSIASAMEGTE